jgi:hypothetical protein
MTAFAIQDRRPCECGEGPESGFISHSAPVKWRAFNWQLAIHRALGAFA